MTFARLLVWIAQQRERSVEMANEIGDPELGADYYDGYTQALDDVKREITFRRPGSKTLRRGGFLL